MRFAFILAFVSSVFFTTAVADARPSGDSIAARKPVKAQKRRAAKVSAKKAKPKKAPKEEVVIEETPAPAAKVEAAPVRRGAPVAQATDDEVPRNEPGRKKR